MKHVKVDFISAAAVAFLMLLACTAQNTAVLFMSDNGPMQLTTTDTDWDLRNNHGFLRNKARLWQNGLNSPLYVRWAGQYQTVNIDRLVRVTDIFPTLLGIAGISLPQNNLLVDKRSIKLYLEGDTDTLDENSVVFLHTFPIWAEGRFSPVQQKEKAAFEFDDQRITLMNESYKLLHNPFNVDGSPAIYQGTVLIDLDTDLLENTNAAIDNQAVVHFTKQHKKKWFDKIQSESHSFAPPVYHIGWNGKGSSEVKGYGPSRTSGCENTNSHQLEPLDKVGDCVEYKIHVHRSGLYKLSISTSNSNLAGMVLKVTCGKDVVEAELINACHQLLGLIPLGPGEHSFSLEVKDIKAGTSAEIRNLKAIQFDLDDDSKGLSDPLATKETAMLFRNLKKIGRKGIIFGHHLAVFEGQNWRDTNISTYLRSDCFASVGDHPGLFGFDFIRGITIFKNYSEEIFRRGGISTYSWHAKNPVTGGTSYDKRGNAVASILAGDEAKQTWLNQLDQMADYLNTLSVQGTKVPIIFRPFHENTGSWFWWGKGNCTSQEFTELWRLTIDYLRIEKGVHNMLIAYSPSKPVGNCELTYEMYPGDNYVDIIGFDAYHKDDELKSLIVDGARFVCEWAQESNKVPAITELGVRSGIHNSNNPDWFGSGFLDLIRNDEKAKNVAYVLKWRNSSPDSYWVPLPGQPTYNSFVNFYNDPTTYFLNDNIYYYQHK